MTLLSGAAITDLRLAGYISKMIYHDYLVAESLLADTKYALVASIWYSFCSYYLNRPVAIHEASA